VKGKSIENVGDFDPRDGNTVDGVQTHLSSVREGDREDDALREDDDCPGCWLSRHCGMGW